MKNDTKSVIDEDIKWLDLNGILTIGPFDERERDIESKIHKGQFKIGAHRNVLICIGAVPLQDSKKFDDVTGQAESNTAYIYNRARLDQKEFNRRLDYLIKKFNNYRIQIIWNHEGLWKQKNNAFFILVASQLVHDI